MICLSVESKMWIVFFAACAQQRAKLALVFGADGLEGSVDHFDEILVSDLNYIILTHSFI